MSQEDNGRQELYNEDTKIEQKVKDDIAGFLRDLADKMEKNSLPPVAVRQISELFMKFHFFNSLLDNIDENTDENVNDESEEMVKFLSLGWYVYKHLLPLKED